jgi:hypothetical protein
VAGNDRIERRPQGDPIEPALQPQAGRDVIGRTGSVIELVQKPEALLAE